VNKDDDDDDGNRYIEGRLIYSFASLKYSGGVNKQKRKTKVHK